jgi:hypothetical protein
MFEPDAMVKIASKRWKAGRVPDRAQVATRSGNAQGPKRGDTCMTSVGAASLLHLNNDTTDHRASV